jgi:hypothetical protein
VSIRVAGIATGRYVMIDGRAGDHPDEVAQMVAAFAPDTVPVLTGHGGELLGYLDSLTIEHRRDLRFAGSVSTDDPDVLDRLRMGSGASIETVVGVEPYEGQQPAANTWPHFRGQLRQGQNLVGVALSNNPAAKFSAIWALPDQVAPETGERDMSKNPNHRYTDRISVERSMAYEAQPGQAEVVKFDRDMGGHWATTDENMSRARTAAGGPSHCGSPNCVNPEHCR